MWNVEHWLVKSWYAPVCLRVAGKARKGTVRHVEARNGLELQVSPLRDKCKYKTVKNGIAFINIGIPKN